MPVNPLYDAKDLLQGIAEGDETAFPKLYHQYMPKVYQYALHYMQQVHLAEEIVQDVFTKIWLHKKKLTLIERFEAYLRTMTRNTCFQHLRKLANEEKARTEWALQAGMQGRVTAENIVSKDYEDHLQQYISRLPERRGMVYAMHLQGFKNEEIAHSLAISKNTVKVHLAVAAKTMRRYFDTLKNILLPLIITLVNWQQK